VVSLLTLTAISVDRLLALLLGLRYRQVVTVEKTYIAIIAFWIVSVLGVPASTAILEYDHYTGTALCLAITIVAYSKIFFRLRDNQIHRIHPLQGESQAIQMNIARYRKAVYGALWVQAALVVCYLPLIPLVGGGTPRMKGVGMLVVSPRGVNFGFGSHLGCSGQNAIILSREGLV